MPIDAQKFSGGVAVITGAGAGIGMGLSKRAAALGMTVVVADINLVNAQKVADEIVSTGGKAEAFFVDVSKPAELDRLADHVFANHGMPRLLVNNAGISHRSPFAATETAVLRRVVLDRAGHHGARGQFFEFSRGVVGGIGGAAQIDGIEMDVSWAVTDQLGISAGFAWLDSELTENYCGFVNANGKPETRADCPSVDEDGNPTTADPEARKGTTLPVTPEWKANATVRLGPQESARIPAGTWTRA